MRIDNTPKGKGTVINTHAQHTSQERALFGLRFWQQWLFILGIVLVNLGVCAALYSGASVLGLAEGRISHLVDEQINPVFWEMGDIPLYARYFQRWIYGVLGTTLAGWGMFLAFIAHYAFKDRQQWAWYCILIGFGMWFLVNTVISLLFGVYFIVLLNCIILVLVLLPLIGSRAHFFEEADESPY